VIAQVMMTFWGGGCAMRDAFRRQRENRVRGIT
jgi:hypothetical protein